VQRHLENCPEKSKQHRAGSVNLGCPFCTFVFHKRNIRNLHLLSHVDKGLACALCDNGVIWDDWKTLRKHYQQKHGKAMLDKISPFGRDLPHRQPPLRLVVLLNLVSNYLSVCYQHLYFIAVFQLKLDVSCFPWFSYSIFQKMTFEYKWLESFWAECRSCQSSNRVKV